MKATWSPLRLLKQFRMWFVAAGLLVVLGTAGIVYAQVGGGFDLSWSTIDGGGASSTGGSYELGGTIGQPDAGVQSGGVYTLQGGFWPGTLANPSPTPTSTPTHTSTSTSTSTSTPTRTSTSTNTPTGTSTPTLVPTQTPGGPAATLTPTGTSTPTRTNTVTSTPTLTLTDTQTPTETPTNTATNTPIYSPTNTATPQPTQTPGGPSATPVPSNTPTYTPTRTITPTPTFTSTNTPMPSHTPIITDTPAVPTDTPTYIPTTPPTQTPGGSTATPEATRTPGPTFTPLPTQTTGGPSATPAPSDTAPPSATVPTSTPTAPQSTVTPGGATPTETVCTLQFQDVPPDSTFYPYVRCMACRGIVNGYTSGCETGNPCFRPGNDVTRGQLSKIVSNSAGFNDPPGAQMFEDMPPGSTFYDYVQRLASRGYISGYPCGGPGEPCGPNNLPYFRTNNNATRGQISKIVSNAAGFHDPPGDQIFEDVPPGFTFYDYIQRLASRNVMSGYSCGGQGEPCMPPLNRPYFRPGNNATRGQTSKIVANTFFPDCYTPVVK